MDSNAMRHRSAATAAAPASSAAQSPFLKGCYYEPEQDGNAGNANSSSHRRRTSTSTSTSATAPTEGNSTAPAVPYIDFRGQRYYSDRFYLNSSSSESGASFSSSIDEDENATAEERVQSPAPASCACGTTTPPPTFPRIDFVNSLQLTAAVFGTFGLDLNWFYQTFPQFGGARNSSRSSSGRSTKDKKPPNEVCSNNTTTTVPTIIFHGARGLETAIRNYIQHAEDVLDYDTEEDDENHTRHSHHTEEEDHTTNKNNTKKSNPNHNDEEFVPPKTIDIARHFMHNKNLQLYQVYCNWDTSQLYEVNKNSTKVSSEPDKTSTRKKRKSRNSSSSTIETRMGVHHPKFMLLFEKNGDVVVIVSTANLTGTAPSTVEGSWVQRFQRVRPRATMTSSSQPKQQRRYPQQQHSRRTNTTTRNDFGPVLQDFLFQLSKAHAAGTTAMRRKQQREHEQRELEPKTTDTLATNNKNNTNTNGNKDQQDTEKEVLPLETFFADHLGITALTEFGTAYNFESARAYLVPIVPGDYRYDPTIVATAANQTTKTKTETVYYYGRQRLRYLLEHILTKKSVPMISYQTNNKQLMDRLVLQPTSLGNDWTTLQFAALIRDYMGYYDQPPPQPMTTTMTTTSKNNKSSATARNSNSTGNTNQHHRTSSNNKKQFYHDDGLVCQNADIIWPTDQYIVQSAIAHHRARENKTKGAATNTTTSSRIGSSITITSPLMAATSIARKNHVRPTLQSGLYNSSKNFNSFASEFLSRFVVYQPSDPVQTIDKDEQRRQRQRGNTYGIHTNRNDNNRVRSVTKKKTLTTVKNNTIKKEKEEEPDGNKTTTGMVTIKHEFAEHNVGGDKLITRGRMTMEENQNKKNITRINADHEIPDTATSASTITNTNNDTNANPPNKSPHFKSIARLFRNHSAMHKRDVPPADAYFSWFLMTSACLSHGAQGATVDMNAGKYHLATTTSSSKKRRRTTTDIPQHQPQTASRSSQHHKSLSSPSPTASSFAGNNSSSIVGYRNFELGVLFASYLPLPRSNSKKRKSAGSTLRINTMSSPQQQQQERRFVYCFRPHQCSCNNNGNKRRTTNTTIKREQLGSYSLPSSSPTVRVSSLGTISPSLSATTPELIHLPVPYNVQPESYFERQNDDDDDDDDDDELWMKYNPFFHEITDDNRCIRNMQLTPFGRNEIRQMHKTVSSRRRKRTT